MIRRATAGLLCAALGASAASVAVVQVAAAQEPSKVTVKGRLLGGEFLMNPVWKEAKDPKRHRYTFRQPSTTVSKNAKKLTAYLPKEVAVVALGDGPRPSGPFPVHLSGGRTTPVTIVVAEGQNVQFINHDPFPHMLYSVDQAAGALGPEKTDIQKQRTWKPPKVGVYEIRDKMFPSVRSWVVVEPKAVAVGQPNTKGEFLVPNVPPGSYELRAFFNGQPVGEALKVDVKPGPELQLQPNPLVVAKKPDEDDDKDDGKEGN
ncbi:MAG: hypothetical protein KC731_35295 [Myxococcales bacterium]|nr:hypothetical protein [Myxococcales bacterium]